MFQNPSWFPPLSTQYDSQHEQRCLVFVLFWFAFRLRPLPCHWFIFLLYHDCSRQSSLPFWFLFFFISALMFHCLSPKSYHAFVSPRPGLVSLFSCPFISSLISWIWPVFQFLSDYPGFLLSACVLTSATDCKCGFWIKLNKNSSCTCVFSAHVTKAQFLNKMNIAVFGRLLW